MDDTREKLTVPQAARRGRMSPRQMQRLCETEPGLAARAFPGARWHIDPEALDRVLAKRGHVVPPVSDEEAIKAFAAWADKHPSMAAAILFGRRRGKSLSAVQIMSDIAKAAAA